MTASLSNTITEVLALAFLCGLGAGAALCAMLGKLAGKDGALESLRVMTIWEAFLWGFAGFVVGVYLMGR